MRPDLYNKLSPSMEHALIDMFAQGAFQAMSRNFFRARGYQMPAVYALERRGLVSRVYLSGGPCWLLTIQQSVTTFIEPTRREQMAITKITLTAPASDMIQRAAFSDLFFNHEHPERDALYRPLSAAPTEEPDVDEDEERAALYRDASDFADTLANATGVRLDPAELVSDFLGRM